MPAYKKMPSAMKECVGPECGGCSSGNCYSKGGGVHDPIGKWQHGKPQGVSVAGENTRSGDKDRMSTAKYIHKKNLEDLKTMKKPNLYAEGGEVGVHHKSRNSSGAGTSEAGHQLRVYPNEDKHRLSGQWHGEAKDKAKEEHRRVLGEMKSMPKPHGHYAEGGAVDSWTKREDNEKGVHHTMGAAKHSRAGHFVRSDNSYTEEQDKGESMHSAKREHHKVLGEMRSMKKPKLYAEGGEVDDYLSKRIADNKKALDLSDSSSSPEGKQIALNADADSKSYAEGGEIADGEPEMEEELKHAMGGELMDALERKDRHGIMSALEAIVLSCRGRG